MCFHGATSHHLGFWWRRAKSHLLVVQSHPQVSGAPDPRETCVFEAVGVAVCLKNEVKMMFMTLIFSSSLFCLFSWQGGFLGQSVCGFKFLKGKEEKKVSVGRQSIIILTNITSGSHLRLHFQVLYMDLFIDSPLIKRKNTDKLQCNFFVLIKG